MGTFGENYAIHPCHLKSQSTRTQINGCQIYCKQVDDFTPLCVRTLRLSLVRIPTMADTRQLIQCYILLLKLLTSMALNFEPCIADVSVCVTFSGGCLWCCFVTCSSQTLAQSCLRVFLCHSQSVSFQHCITTYYHHDYRKRWNMNEHISELLTSSMP